MNSTMQGFQTSLLYEDHKAIYKNIRNYLAGRFVGATRDRTLLNEVVKCLFCYTYLTKAKEQITTKDGLELSGWYRKTFSIIKQELPNIFEPIDEIQLDPASITFVHNELSKIVLQETNRDPFGDLYEVFIGTGVREEEGQFFTPQNGVQLLLSIIDPQKGEIVLDPAAGAGGFLSATFQHLKKQGLSDQVAAATIIGIEKDAYLAKLAATRLALISLQSSKIICGDSLAWQNETGESIAAITPTESVDVILTNPPFGKKIVSATKAIQKTFELGYQWKYQREEEQYNRTTKLLSNAPPQVLFVERCLRLLKPGGRLGIVVPESLITSKSYQHVVQYMRVHGQIKTVMGMPEDFFKTSGKGGTHTKACLITMQKYDKEQATKASPIFMAEAKWCGHDSRGRSIKHDDLPIILENYQKYQANQRLANNHLGYTLSNNQIEGQILSPRYYNPELNHIFETINETHDVVTIGELVKQNVLEIKTGDEVGKLAYGTGQIPFIRTSDISNWEMKVNPKHKVSEAIYQKYAAKQDIQENDVLMVKDGTYLIGTCAIITQHDVKMVYQSHLYKIRVKAEQVISPYLLLALLSSEIVQQQIKSKRFTQDIIDSLGRRINELKIPIPKDRLLVEKIEQAMKKAIQDRATAREIARQACVDISVKLN